MNTTKPFNKIDAEIEALRARIRRLRLQRKVSALAVSERKLRALAVRAAEGAAEGGGEP